MFYRDFLAKITVVVTGIYEFNLFIMNPGDTPKCPCSVAPFYGRFEPFV